MKESPTKIDFSTNSKVGINQSISKTGQAMKKGLTIGKIIDNKAIMK